MGLMQVLRGAGRVAPPDPGNTANAPGLPPVQAGNYEYIQTVALQGFGHNISDIFTIPPEFQDWGQMMLGVGDPSGIYGGGTAYEPQTMSPTETGLFYDTNTGLYYDLGNTNP
jgi:hypothetical protein